jgi:outer membrane protein, multidrug efflux system
MYRKKIIRTLLSVTSASALVVTMISCKMTEPYRDASVPAETRFRDQPGTDTANFANVPWDSLFTDPLLDTLISEALMNNPDLQIAMVNIKKAEAVLSQSTAALFPSLNLSAGATFQGSGNSDDIFVSQVAASSSWEIDIWGKLNSARKADYDLYLKSEALGKAVMTQLIADIANSYYSLLALDEQLRITEKTVEYRSAEVENMKTMKDNDMVTGADLVLSQSNLYSAKVRIPDIRQRIYELENVLSVLTGNAPGPVKRGILSEQDLKAGSETGIPAQLLANRPDVQAAEFQLRYGYEMTKAARRSFFPSLTIAATGGYQASKVPEIFKPSSVFWNLIGGLTQPVFNQGINRQRLRLAKANQEQNLIAYRQVMLRASQEVADAVNGYHMVTDKIALRSEQIGYLEKSVDFTTELLKYTSTTNYNDVLTAEVALLSAQLSSVDDKLQQLQYIVELYRSLGGGWRGR